MDHQRRSALRSSGPGEFDCSSSAKQGTLIAGDQPVTEEQVRGELQSGGWANVQIVREGRYFEVSAIKNGQIGKLAVDSQTGRLRAKDDDDD
jgi:hypothetical protein